MSKNNKDTEQEQELEQDQPQEQTQEQPQDQEPEVPNGSAAESDSESDTYPKILSAPTREELASLIDNLTAPEGASLIAGCVARDTVTGAYIIQIDIL